MMPLSYLDVEVRGQRVLVRQDLNVPLSNGQVTSAERIERALPTIAYLLNEGAAVILTSHLGRPTPGQYDPAYSLAPVAARLAEALGQPVRLVTEWRAGVDVAPGEVVLCENLRFEPGEKENDPALAQQLAALCDIFMMDAFAAAHRAHASTVGVVSYAKIACAGPLFLSEINTLHQELSTPDRPYAAIVGGAKVSSKFELLTALVEKVDFLLVGGGIANTCLAAVGHPIGASLYEPEWLDSARTLMARAAERGVDMPLPQDVLVSDAFSASATATVRAVDAVQPGEMILDVGPKTRAQYTGWMASMRTIIWNGPVDVFEFPAFAAGTAALGEAIVNSQARCIAGGGDTVAALEQYHISDKMHYISTGGGAFLTYLQTYALPALSALTDRMD